MEIHRPGARTEPGVVVSLTEPSAPRLRLLPVAADKSLLDGAWWPRSADPVAELPGLILAVDTLRAGPVTRLMLHASTWNTHPIRLAVAGRVVRLGYLTSHPVDLLIALCGSAGVSVDLLTIPPDTPHDIAELSMARAASADNKLRIEDLVEAMRASSTQHDMWESEGGHLARASNSSDGRGASNGD